MKTIMITGICGVGKSTVTKELSAKLKLTWGDYADMMLEVMGETDKDKIQYLSWEKKRRVYDQVERLVVVRFNPKNADRRIHLLENHLSVIQDGKIITFPPEDYRKYNMIGLVVIEAGIKEIFERRKTDKTRKRLKETAALIGKQQKISWEEAQKITRYLEIPLLRVKNKDNYPPVTVVESWIEALLNQIGNR